MYGASGSQKRIRYPEAMWILGLELGSSGRAASALHDGTISPSL